MYSRAHARKLHADAVLHCPAFAAMKLELLLSSLFGHDSGAAAGDLRLPSLDGLLARAAVEPLPAQTMDQFLSQRFSLDAESMPIAPLALLGDRGDPGSDYVLRADPVHLALNRDRLILADATAFPLSHDEATQFVGTLNRHFTEAGIAFEAPHPSRWYARTPLSPELATTPISILRGKSIEVEQFAGKGRRRWQTIQTEAQMLLHDHAVNQAREARGEWPINSLWFWGGGRLPEVEKSPYRCVVSDNPWHRGLARHFGMRAASLADWQTLELRHPYTTLIAVDTLDAPFAYGDAAAWREILAALETNVFGPALTALRSGALEQVSLVSLTPERAWRATLRPGQSRQFWRRRKSWREFA